MRRTLFFKSAFNSLSVRQMAERVPKTTLGSREFFSFLPLLRILDVDKWSALARMPSGDMDGMLVARGAEVQPTIAAIKENIFGFVSSTLKPPYTSFPVYLFLQACHSKLSRMVAVHHVVRHGFPSETVVKLFAASLFFVRVWALTCEAGVPIQQRWQHLAIPKEKDQRTCHFFCPLSTCRSPHGFRKCRFFS